MIAPDAKVKAKWLAKIQQNNSSIGFSTLSTAISSLYPSEQTDLNEISAEQRLLSLPEIDKANGPVFMRSSNRLIPATCSETSAERLKTAANELTELPVGAKQSLLIKLQKDERCLLIKNNLSLSNYVLCMQAKYQNCDNPANYGIT